MTPEFCIKTTYKSGFIFHTLWKGLVLIQRIVQETFILSSKCIKFSDLQDSQDPLANSLLQPQCPGTLVLELDWLPLRANKNDPLVLCVAGADSSFRLIEVAMYVEATSEQ